MFARAGYYRLVPTTLRPLTGILSPEWAALSTRLPGSQVPNNSQTQSNIRTPVHCSEAKQLGECSKPFGTLEILMELWSLAMQLDDILHSKSEMESLQKLDLVLLSGLWWHAIGAELAYAYAVVVFAVFLLLFIASFTATNAPLCTTVYINRKVACNPVSLIGMQSHRGVKLRIRVSIKVIMCGWTWRGMSQALGRYCLGLPSMYVLQRNVELYLY